MKYLLYSILILAILTLCGCTDINIDFSLLPDNSVSSEISINVLSGEIDTKDLTDAQEKLISIGTFLEESGYTVNINTASDTWALSATQFNQYENATQASEAFYSLLKSDFGIFNPFNFFSRISDIQSTYYFSGQFDAKNLLAENQTSSLPTDISDRLNKYLGGKLGNITVRLPASSASSGDSEIETTNNTATVEIPIYFDSPVNLNLETTVNGEPPQIANSDINERIDYTNTTILITKYISIGCGVLIFIIIILMFILNGRRKYT